MEKSLLFFASWSNHCVKAEEALEKARFPFEIVNLENSELIVAACRDYGIRKLPALKVNGRTYEGLSAVVGFLESESLTSR